MIRDLSDHDPPKEPYFIQDSTILQPLFHLPLLSKKNLSNLTFTSRKLETVRDGITV